MSQHYTYNPLPTPSSIRLVHVNNTSEDGSIDITLRCVNLDDFPLYQCLSSTWGDPFGRDMAQRDYTISCHGRAFKIKENLRAAIQYMWRLNRLELDGIWIDAICINQDDLDERSQQVSMMKRIYASAERTIVWLGPEDPETEQVFEALDLIGGYLEDKPHAVEAIKVPHRRDYFTIMHELLALVRDPYSGLRFMDRAYFERVWIIQEVCVISSLHIHADLLQAGCCVC